MIARGLYLLGSTSNFKLFSWRNRAKHTWKKARKGNWVFFLQVPFLKSHFQILSHSVFILGVILFHIFFLIRSAKSGYCSLTCLSAQNRFPIRREEEREKKTFCTKRWRDKEYEFWTNGFPIDGSSSLRARRIAEYRCYTELCSSNCMTLETLVRKKRPLNGTLMYYCFH